MVPNPESPFHEISSLSPPFTNHVFFFFQAEDGIRDKLVTGVQTCALPIYEGKEVPLKIDDRRLQGSLVLFQAQKYRIVVEDPLGFGNSPISYEMRVRPDGFPTVDILRPTEDLEISGDETLPLEFSARDDFGLQEVALAIKIGDRQEKIPIEREENRKLILRQRFDWDLAKLGLREGDEAIYHLEVLDNDTISGP